MPSVTDDRGRVLDLSAPAQRVVSLVPSSTETLAHLLGPDAVVGVTRFCTHPADRIAGWPKVGGTKDVETDRVVALAPDLVVANAEENSREIFAALDPLVPLYVAFPRTVDQAVDDLVRLGELVGAPERAAAWAAEIRASRADLATVARPFTYAYLIWRGPWMSINQDTFIDAMLAEAGGANAFADADARYPTVSAADLVAADPDVVLLASEPFPFKAAHAAELCEATGWGPERVRFADGELCSWHGVRMASAFRWLQECATGGWPTAPTPAAPDVEALG